MISLYSSFPKEVVVASSEIITIIGAHASGSSTFDISGYWEPIYERCPYISSSHMQQYVFDNYMDFFPIQFHQNMVLNNSKRRFEINIYSHRPMIIDTFEKKSILISSCCSC